MRVISLNADEGAPAEVDVEVCIVGAGAAGLYLAHRLADGAGSVAVLEAGPAIPVSASSVDFECDFTTDPYRGATEGRAFGIGGTTARWGGQLVAFPPSDAVRDDAVMRGVWQHILRIGDAFGPEVMKALGVEQSTPGRTSEWPAQEVSIFNSSGLLPAESSWLPFQDRNFTRFVRASRGQHDAVTVYCDSVVAGWSLDQGSDGCSRITEVVAQSRSGRTLRVKARRIVISAGAIESTRLLQEINVKGAGQVIPPRSALGRYFSDHLSFRIGEFDASARRRVAQLFGPRFLKDSMRTLRVTEASPDPHNCHYFAHVVFPTENPGFQLARAVLQGLQARRPPSIGLCDLGRGGMGALMLAWHRWIHSRLYIAPDSPCHMQIDMEQRPNVSNSIALGDELDRFGRPVASINWSVCEQDEVDMMRACAALLSQWSSVNPELLLDPGIEDGSLLAKPHDAYHPVGTCRMGSDSAAVVGFDLNVHGTENLYVLSTAIFPSAGSANPTFNLLCFAEMLVGALKARVTN